jgi:uncharacterized membrane protein required for colicin V production
MNWLDYILIFILILNLYSGFKHGLISQVVKMVSLFIAIYFAVFWSSDLKGYLVKYLKLDEVVPSISQNGEVSIWLTEIMLNIVSFMILFLLIGLILSLFTGRLKILNRIPIIGPVNALSGGLLGAAKGILIIFLIVALLSLIETEFMNNMVDASVLVALSHHYMPLIFGLIMNFIMGRLGTIV